ncbi:MAG: hypothetical protein AAGA54_27065 [Myxococcota bacterium]
MSTVGVLVMLLAGPPSLPDLPAERAAKARAEAQARAEAEAKARAEAEAKAKARARAEAKAKAEQEPAVGPDLAPSDAPDANGPEEPQAQGPAPSQPPAASKAPLSAAQLAAAAEAAPAEPLALASERDAADWADDDAVYGEDGSADAGSRRAASPGDIPRAGARPPSRTATGAELRTRLEQPARTEPPRRSSAFVFGYRLFAIQDAFARPQSWHVGSVEVTPVRRFVRFNLITEVGAEGGAAARGKDRADLFMMQKAGLGVQYPHWLTPFVEFQGGAGVARVELFDRSDLLLLWTLGLDVGAQWSVTRWMSFHAAAGWIRPTFQRSDRAIYHDSFTFKLGLGF